MKASSNEPRVLGFGSPTMSGSTAWLAFRRFDRHGVPQQPTQLTGIGIWGDLRTLAVADRIYVTWVRYDGDIAGVYVARGPFGCGVFEGEGE